MPYIIGQQKPFPAVQGPDEIVTEELLEAATGVAQIVGSMGGQFSMTRDDMLGNIKKIRTKFEEDKEKFRLLKAILQDELDNKKNKNDGSGSIGSLWLKRGLEYLTEVFWELIKEHDASKQPGGKSNSGAVKAACKAAYDKTLTKYHNMAARMLVKGGLMVSPYKQTFMDNLSGGEKDKDDEIVEEMRAFEVPLRTFVIAFGQLMQQFGYEKDECIENIHDGASQ